MNMVIFTPQYALSSESTADFLVKLFRIHEQINNIIACGTKLKDINNQILGIVGQMDENVCLVEYLDFNEELIFIRSFVNRGEPQILAESIIGNGLVIGSRYIIVLRNRKSGIPIPTLHDRQLIRYLLSGLCNLETILQDYIINNDGGMFSTKEVGILKTNGKASSIL
jgi:hypothetical protein